MANGKGQMANGKWQMANGKWQMANGKWRMANGGSMLTRIITALVLAPVVVAAAWLAPGTAGAGLAVLCTVLAAYEYMGLFSLKENRGLFWVAVAWTGLGPVSAWLGSEVLSAWLFCSPMLALGLFLVFPERIPRAWSEAPAVGMGAVYLGVLMSAVVLLARLPDWGASGLLMLFAVVWLGDSAAYFAGKSIGRHKLYERVSPKKTWEGSWFGLAGSIGGAFLVDAIFSSPLSSIELTAVGLVAGAAEQVGDLCESVLKRSVGIKDSGSLLPGHGGMLDRVDGLLFAAPIVYWFYLAAIG